MFAKVLEKYLYSNRVLAHSTEKQDWHLSLSHRQRPTLIDSELEKLSETESISVEKSLFF